MTCSQTAPTTPGRTGPLPAPAGYGITVYGCDPEESALVRAWAPHFGLVPTITAAAPSVAGAALARGQRCISVGHRTPISNPTLLALSKAGVRYLSTRSIGANHLDTEYAAGLGILVENVAYSPASVADFTVMAMLMAVRDAKAMVRRTDVHDYRLPALRGRELRDLTVGVIGTGRIGLAVIERLRGFGCRVVAHDTRRSDPVRYVSLEELVRTSDIVTLHTPLTDRTHHLLDGPRIEQMKPGAFVINTGRGALLDTAALLRALESGRLGGAALDVLEGEEGTFYADLRGRTLAHEALTRLQRMPNVLISPHTAYYTDHALRDAVADSLRNCRDYEESNPWPRIG